MTIWSHLKQAFFPWRADRSREGRSERRHPVTWEDGQSIEAALIDSSVPTASCGGTRSLGILPQRPAFGGVPLESLDGGDWLSGLQFTAQASGA